MGHVVLTTATSRVEMNLNADQEAVVARLLLGMIAAEPAGLRAGSAGRGGSATVPAAASGGDDSPGAGDPPFPVSEHAMSVEKAEAAQASEPEPGTTVHEPRTMNHEPASVRLLPRTCKRDGCERVFQPTKANQDFCGQRCRKAFWNARRARATTSEPGNVKCPECPQTFKTHQALGGHMNGHTKDRRAGKSKARQDGLAARSTARDEGRFECACGRRFTTGELRQIHQDEEDCRYECGCGETFASAQAQALHQTRTHLKATKAARSTARPVQALTKPLQVSRDPAMDPQDPAIVPTAVDRPYACKEPGCGHPCRSQGELASHRRAYHDTKHPLPKVTQVLAALSFPCPEAGCGRVYDDGNRLVHHLRVIHDRDTSRRGEERIVLSDREVLDGLTAGTVRAVRVG